MSTAAPGAQGAPDAPEERVAVAVITRNRRDQLLDVLARLAALPERPVVAVVDNASTDGTAQAVARHRPGTLLARSRSNLGAAARNALVAGLDTRYVAFNDDDTWWEPGSLSRAADLLDAHPHVASLTARVLVEPGGTEDPITPELRHSPLPRPPGLPGPALLGVLAGATVVRSDAFLAAGGFSPRLLLGGEEELLSLDLAAAGWWMCWSEELTVHHEPSTARDGRARRRQGIRNTLWTAWLRRPLPGALRRTGAVLRSVPRDAVSASALARAAAGLPWAVRERAPVEPRIEAWLRLLEEHQRRGGARRFV